MSDYAKGEIVSRLRHFGKLCGYDIKPLFEDAAAEIEQLRAALQFIADGYDNHDINHVDYRVKVYQAALGALDAVGGGKEP